MENLKKIIKCLVFCGIFLLMLLVLGQILLPKKNHPDYGMEEKVYVGALGEEENTLDVLFLGNSVSMTAFMPTELWNNYGFTSYQCGSSAEKIYEIYDHLKDILKYQKPSLVVLETHPMFYDDFEFEKWLASEVNNAFPAVEYHDHWRSLRPLDFTQKPEYRYITDRKGYYPRFGANPVPDSEYMIPSEDVKKLSYPDDCYFRKIAELCRRNGAELLVVSLPNALVNSWPAHNGMQLAADREGAAYLDLNLVIDEIGLNGRIHSMDSGDHLNYYGALLVTDYMGQYLKEHYDLPDHREDPAYDGWNQANEAFLKELSRYYTPVLELENLYERP